MRREMRRDAIEERIKQIEERIRKIEENEIPHLEHDIAFLKNRIRRQEEGVIIGITLLFYALAPIAFLSAPVMGIICIAAAIYCSYGLYRRKKQEKCS